MKKRNFILIVILTIILILVALVFWYGKKTPTDTTTGGGGPINFLADLLPFGNKNKDQNNTGDQPVDISDYVDESIKEVKPLTLTKVSTMPVAGFGSFMKERFVEVPEVIPGTESAEVAQTPTAPATEFAVALRYVDKVSGNVFQTWADRINERKFTNTVIPQVHEAIFGGKGNSVVMRYLRPDQKTIVSFIGKLPGDTLGADSSSGKVEGTFLPDDTSDIVFSKDGNSMFYIYELGQSAIGIAANSAGEGKTQILDFPYTEWLSLWPNKSTITLTTKASGLSPSYLYKLNPETKEFNKVLGGMYGMTSLTSPDGKLILYGNNKLGLFIYNTETRNERTLKINTLPEKCVWNSVNDLYCAVPKFFEQALYPDAWYMGEVSFEDQLWKVEGSNFIENIVLDLKTNSEKIDIDATKLALSDSEDYLFFINKKDSYLWELRLK